REVVASFGDRRLRHVRPPQFLSMTDNWEFSLGHARGDYVVLIHDDDGLLPHALAEADRVLRLTGTQALRWDAAVYVWPDVAPQRRWLPGSLQLPLRQKDGSHAVYRLDPTAMVREVAAFRAYYTWLPMIYSSAIGRDVLAALRRHVGRVFSACTPDVYSG